MLLNKKVLVRVITALLIVVMAFSLVGCGANGSGKGVVNSLFDAIDKHDAKKFLNCFDEETRDQLLETTDESDIKDQLEAADEQFADEFGNDWKKKIKVGKETKGDTDGDITNYTIEVSMDGDEADFPLVKVDGKYYVDPLGAMGFLGGY